MAFEALKKLQEKCGVSPDGAFGPNTAKAIVKHYELSPKRGAHLLGQLVHESGSFKYTEENLNYSVEACLKVFGKYFKTAEEAEPYARNPKALADKVYGHRMGNNGQGYVWRGRGFLQLTGRDQYRSFASDMRVPEVMDNPDLVATDYAMESALHFFKKNNIWKVCDEGVNYDIIKRITRIINGGHNGLAHRVKETEKIHGWLT
jgi:putative chitinase